MRYKAAITKDDYSHGHNPKTNNLFYRLVDMTTKTIRNTAAHEAISSLVMMQT